MLSYPHSLAPFLPQRGRTVCPGPRWRGPEPQNTAGPNAQLAGSQALGVTLGIWAMSVHLRCTLLLLTIASLKLETCLGSIPGCFLLRATPRTSLARAPPRAGSRSHTPPCCLTSFSSFPLLGSKAQVAGCFLFYLSSLTLSPD